MLELQTANKNKRTKNGGGDGITALYCRLSVDDNGTEGESNSIKNQRDILGRYAKQHGYRNIEYYIDDGYSGTNFNRPDFQRMMSDVDEGKVKTIIVKDNSWLRQQWKRWRNSYKSPSMAQCPSTKWYGKSRNQRRRF